MGRVLLFQGLVGLTEAMYLWLVAAGLSLIFGVLRVLNFAHGALYMIGAYLTYAVFRACGGNFWIALLVGPVLVVRSSRLFTGVFMLGAWLAGLGGALSIPVRSISPGMGELIIIEAFVVVVLGGLGSLRGAFIGSLAIGLLHSYGIVFLPVFELALAYLVMAAVLVVRPWGLFGVREA